MDCAIISRRGGGGGWGLRNGKEVVKNRALPPNPRRKTKYEPSFIQKINETPPKHTHTHLIPYVVKIEMKVKRTTPRTVVLSFLTSVSLLPYLLTAGPFAV